MQFSLASRYYSPYVLSLIPSEYRRDIQVSQAVKNVSTSYDAIVDLFASFENFLSRLSIYTGIPPTQALTTVLVKIIVELLSTLALATKQVRQGRLSEFVLDGMTFDSWDTEKFIKKLRGENDIEATLQRLDRLTLDEARATAAQTLEVVYGLVRHRRVVMDGEEIYWPHFSLAEESLEADGDESAASISCALGKFQID